MGQFFQLPAVQTSSSLPANAATASNQTDGSQKTQIVNGANTAAVKAASTAAVAADPSLVVALSPNSPGPFAGLISGSISGAFQPVIAPLNGGASAVVVVSGTWTGSISVFGVIGSGNRALYIDSLELAGQFSQSNIGVNGTYRIAIPAGFTQINFVALSWSSGTANLTVGVANGASIVDVLQLNAKNLNAYISPPATFQPTIVNLAAATATQILPANANRVFALIQNSTGAPAYYGPSAVSNTGAGRGLAYADGSIYEYKNQSALFAFSVLGGTGDTGILVQENIK